MKPFGIVRSRPVRTLAQWANIVAFGVVLLGLLVLGELAVSQIIGISRAPDQTPDGLGQLVDYLLPWLLSLLAVVIAGGLGLWSFIKNHKPRAWALMGAAYLLPFMALTLRF